MDAYGIERSEVDKTIRIGMKWKEQNSEKWHAKFEGIECVFGKKEDIIIVITIYPNGD